MEASPRSQRGRPKLKDLTEVERLAIRAFMRAPTGMCVENRIRRVVKVLQEHAGCGDKNSVDA